jgi:pimeloyl-ACP methyl ester carboxylesterase
LPVARADLASYVENLPNNSNPATVPALITGSAFAITVSAQSEGAYTQLDVTRAFKAPSVMPLDVNTARLRGKLFQPVRASAANVAVLVIGGSNGGLTEGPAMLFASHGYPALALAYFDYADLPRGLVNIPLEVFAEGATWLKQTTGAAHIVIWGVSRGSEAALLTAAHFPDLLSGVIAVSPAPVPDAPFGPGAGPSDFAWTLAGKGIPFGHLAPDEEKRFENVWTAAGKTAPGAEGTPYYLEIWNDPSVMRTIGIPVEKIKAPLLLLAGASDTMWPSWLGAHRIRDRMVSSGSSAMVEVHTYPGAGHFIWRPGVGSEIASFGWHRIAKEFVSYGGLAVPNCEATFDVWSQQLRFLGRIR